MDASTKLKAFAERWAGARPAERANAESYLRELAEALGVEPPRLSLGGALLARFRWSPPHPTFEAASPTLPSTQRQ